MSAGPMRYIPRLDRLTPIERDHLRVQVAHAPAGHEIILGPFRGQPFYWACAICGVRWVDGFHPVAMPEAARRSEPEPVGVLPTVPDREPESERPPWWDH